MKILKGLPATLSALSGVPADGDTIVAGGGRYAGVSGAYPGLAFGRRTVYTMGDSLTAAGVTADSVLFGSAVNQGGLSFTSSSPLGYALLNSNCRWQAGGVFATGGYTPTQIMNTHVPACLAVAKAGDVCVVLAGTNVIDTATAVVQWPLVKQIHDALRAKGIKTVAVTLPPNGTTTLKRDNVHAFNEMLKDWASHNNVAVLDLHSLMVDPATGLYLSAYASGDTVHPNAAGYKVYGEALAVVLNSLFPANNNSPLIECNVAVTNSLITLPLATGAVLTTNWRTDQTMGTSTVAVAADANFRGGNCYKITVGDNDITGGVKIGCVVAGSPSLIVGHRYRFGYAFSVTPTAPGTWTLGLRQGNQFAHLFGQGSPAMSSTHAITRLFCEFTPTGTNASFPNVVPFLTTAGTTMSVGELTLFDLTAMGLT